MPGGITFLQSANADIPTPPSGKVTVYFSTDLGAPAYKDSSGNVHPLKGDIGAGGPQGDPGTDGDDGPIGPIGPPGPTGSTGATGAQGSLGPVFIVDDGNDGNDGMSIPVPGPTGATGATGAAGAPGPPGASDDGGGGDDSIISIPPHLDSGWILHDQHTYSADTTFDFFGLGVYSEVLVFFKQVTLSSAAGMAVRVSKDGSTFLSTSGDYVGVAGNGAETNTTFLSSRDAATATAARTSFVHIRNFNGNGPKHVTSFFFTNDSIVFQYISTSTGLSGVRTMNTAAGNMSGGTVYIFGKR